MNKKGIIIAIVVLLLAGGVVFTLSSKKPASLPQDAAPQNAGGNTSVVTSIKDALTKSATLECKYTDSTGNLTTSYIKNGAVRTDFTASDPKQSGGMIIKDKKMYFWTGQQGFMSEVPDETLTGDVPPDQQNAETTRGRDMINALEEYKDNCKPGIVSDSLFAPPADVTFSDFSTLLKVPPTGAAGVPQGYDQKQLEEYVKQYAPEEDQ